MFKQRFAPKARPEKKIAKVIVKRKKKSRKILSAEAVELMYVLRHGDG